MTLNTIDFREVRVTIPPKHFGAVKSTQDHSDTAEAAAPVHKVIPTGHAVEDVKYEMFFTADPKLIADYWALREKLYGIDPRFVGFRIFSETDKEDYKTPGNHMLILHDGKRCYGGAFLRISTPKHPILMDIEQDILPPKGKFYFSLRENLPEIELDKYAYAEFTRMVLDPCLRTGEVTRKMFKAMLNRCIEYRVRYMFGIGDKVRTRFYRQIYINMGVKGGIHDGIDIPMRAEYEGLKMYLLHGDMKAFHVRLDDPEATRMLTPVESA